MDTNGDLSAMDYSSSAQRCQDINATLVRIDTELELDFITRILSQVLPTAMVLIGRYKSHIYIVGMIERILCLPF